MISRTEPVNFSPKLVAAGCFLQHQGKILLLLRPNHKSEPNTWQVPGGKHEAGETPILAMKREVFEETGFSLNQEVVGPVTFYVRYPEYDFIYHAFSAVLDEEPSIRITDEHEEYVWITPKEALSLPLIPHGEEVVRAFYEI